ncbi:hypothetical protein Poli38472_008176 [Pythium oligandrum]|uniref:Uncharacterized protein n=1 Tax=Pythium oligandrum TaxID=41045 RepID=A0A8K1FLR8_PYTOL|nr:hypothetical protein Poli38472_008176 [Pythium oligandrum]|eukprot:TMW65534.1 hypothetical protein Poli38472_008176 [Pythium oligandrum]
MSSNVIDTVMLYSDSLLGRVLSAFAPAVFKYEVDDLGPLVPEWGAADDHTPKQPQQEQKKALESVSSLPGAPPA